MAAIVLSESRLDRDLARRKFDTLVAVWLVLCPIAATPALAAFGADLPGGGLAISQYGKLLAVDGRQNDLHMLGQVGPIGGAFVMHRAYDSRRREWLAPDTVTGPGRLQARAIAADGFGQIHIAFMRDGQTGPDELLYVGRDTSETWRAPERIKLWSSFRYVIQGTSIAADRFGNVFVFWTENATFPDSTLSYAFCAVRDHQTRTWLPPVLVSFRDDGTQDLCPQLAVESATPPSVPGLTDTVAVAHLLWGVFGADVYYQALRFDMKPAAQASLAGPRQDLGFATDAFWDIAVRDHSVHAVISGAGGYSLWHTEANTTTSLTANFPPWAEITVGGSAPSGMNPSLALDSERRPHVLSWHWAGGPGFGPQMVAHLTRVGGLWSGPEIVSDVAVATSPLLTRPEIVIDFGDIGHALWGPHDQSCFVGTSSPAAGPVSMPAPPPARGPVRVLVRLRDELTPAELERARRAVPAAEAGRTFVRRLEAHARETQRPLLALLDEGRRKGTVRSYNSLWLVNAVDAWVEPEWIERLRARPEVQSATPVREFRAIGPPGPGRGVPVRSVAPGRGTSGPVAAWGVDWIGAPQVWAQGYRGQCIVVAVLDSGVDSLHIDLAQRLWTNPYEAYNGADEDSSGYADDVHGGNFVGGSYSPFVQDDNGHGTHVAGTVAGDGTGGIATGVAPEAILLPVKVLSGQGSTTAADVVRGMEFALKHRAQVMNLSLGLQDPMVSDPADRMLYRTGCDRVAQVGVTMVVAMGNTGPERSPRTGFTYAYELPRQAHSPGDVPPPWISPDQPPLGNPSGVISVGATQKRRDLQAYFSSSGLTHWASMPPNGEWKLCSGSPAGVGLIKPDLSAPGSGVRSLLPGDLYSDEDWDGTSMATPHVTGLIALLLSKNPKLLPAEIQAILEMTALDLGPDGKDYVYGAGRVRAAEALAAVALLTTPLYVHVDHSLDDGEHGNGDGKLQPGERAKLALRVQNTGPYVIKHATGHLFSNTDGVTILVAGAAFDSLVPGVPAAIDAGVLEIMADSGATSGTVDFDLGIQGLGGCGLVSFADSIVAPTLAVVTPGADLPLRVNLARPNPGRGRIDFEVQGPAGVRLRIEVFDLSGRRIRVLHDATWTGGAGRWGWDGADALGRAAPGGIYLVAARCDGREAARKFVFLGR